MTFDKLLLSSTTLARSGSVLSALIIATFLFTGSLTTVQPTLATTFTAEEQDILDTQDESTENLSESDRDVNGIEFTPRWGGVTTLQPNQIKVGSSRTQAAPATPRRTTGGDGEAVLSRILPRCLRAAC